MKNTLFKTKNGNSYIYSFYHNHTIVAHPILEHILKNQFETDFIDNLLSFDHITIGKKRYSSKEIRHYCSKYIFLKKHHFFSEINIKNILSGNIKAEAIAEQLNSVNDIVFEITEKCNLKCNYCVYGEHYSIHSDRKHFDMEVGNAKRLLDFFTPKWLSDNNNFYENITIGFYGGEPLLKFNTIKEIVEYTQEITKKTGLMFNFNMTSNGLLLSEYIDFLIKHDFTLTVSLDGNDTHNRHRITSAGTPSFDIVYKNIKSVQAKHPVYYKNKMYFNSVLHDLNNEKDVLDFFEKSLDKMPACSPVRIPKKENIGLFSRKECDQVDIDDAKNIENFTKTNEAIAFLRHLKSYGRNIYRKMNEIKKYNRCKILSYR